MNHPSELNLFTQPPPPQRLEIVREQPSIDSLKNWREGDLMDLLELLVQLMRSDEYLGNPQLLLEQAGEFRLPSSLATLLLNTLPRLDRILGISHEEQPLALKHLPNCADLAKWIGLGDVFAKEMQAYFRPAEESKAVANVVEPKVADPPLAPMETPNPSTLAITSNKLENGGRQWKIAGTLVAEVRFVAGLGYSGKLYSGDHVTPLRTYSESAPAESQCRAHAEGILKLLKTIPR